MSKLNIILFADNEQLRNKGLMFSEPLQENQAAFFIFDEIKDHHFFNKNVKYPIDVGFFDSFGNLVHISFLEANQEKSINSNNKIKYVIETRNNWFKENSIEIGHSIWNLINLER